MSLFQLVGIAAIDLQKLRIAMVRSNDLERSDKWFNEKQQLLWQLCDVSWTTLLKGPCRHACDKLCAKFRTRAALLDAMSFETIQDRLGFTNRWKELKMYLANAHSE